MKTDFDHSLRSVTAAASDIRASTYRFLTAAGNRQSPTGVVPGVVRASIIFVVGVAAAVLAGCGSIGQPAGASSGTAPKSSPSPGRGAFANAVAGQVTQVGSGTLTVAQQSGSAKVTFDSTTSVLQSGTGSASEAVAGVCVVATGTTGAGGVITARTFQVQLNMNGNCTPPAGLGGGQGAGGGRGPRGSPSPGAGGGAPPANFGNVRGKLTAVNGSTLTVQPQTGNPVTVMLTSSTAVTRLVTSSTARLAVGECVTANGQKDSSGAVKARTILISPPGANGNCTFAGGGFGGGGRRPGASPPAQSA